MMSLNLPKFLGRNRETGPIGLEVSLEYVHLVQLERIKNQVRLKASASQPLNGSFEELLQHPQQLQAIVKTALKSARFSGNQVVTAMPSTMTQVISVNYETKNGQNDGEAIGKLLLDRIGDDLNDFVVDYMPIHHDNRVNERAALIAMCRKDTVNSYLNVLIKCRLAPAALEIGPVAIKRLVDALQHRQKTASALVVNCGREKSYLTLIAKEHILSDDEVNFGESTIVDRICHALDIELDLALQLLQEADLGAEKPDNNTRTLLEIIRPELNELVREIERGLVYATSENRGNDDTAIFLIGSIARWQGADKLLSSILNHRVKTIPNPLQPFLSVEQQENPLDQGRPELAVAAGLALRDFQHD